MSFLKMANNPFANLTPEQAKAVTAGREKIRVSQKIF
jgi:hypothetical protein